MSDEVDTVALAALARSNSRAICVSAAAAACAGPRQQCPLLRVTCHQPAAGEIVVAMGMPVVRRLMSAFAGMMQMFLVTAA